MKLSRLPESIPLGIVPIDKTAILELLNDPKNPPMEAITHVVVVEKTCCRLFVSEPYENAVPLFNPILSREALAKELVRLAKAIFIPKPKLPPNRSSKGWKIGYATMTANHVGIVASLVWITVQ
jgi:hypothetical protein